MVRLVGYITNLRVKAYCKFQFQHGAISRKFDSFSCNRFFEFQFQHGAISRFVTYFKSISAPLHFNSNMVRLVGIASYEDLQNTLISIPTWCDQQKRMQKLYLVKRQFQFQHGAISSSVFGQRKYISSISIPTWCDQQLNKINN